MQPGVMPCRGGVEPGAVVGDGEMQAALEQARQTVAWEAPAYLAMFCRASRVQKYTVVPVSCG